MSQWAHVQSSYRPCRINDWVRAPQRKFYGYGLSHTWTDRDSIVGVSDRAGVDGVLARRRAQFPRGVRPRARRIEPRIRNGT